MLGVVGQLLPIALAAALSTVPIAVLLVILLSERRSVAALPFALGCVAGTLVAVVLVAVLVQLLPDARPRRAQQLRGLLELFIGVALVVLGVRAWVRRRVTESAQLLPSWADSMLDGIAASRAFGLGVVIELRPKSLLLAGVAGLQIGAAPGDASVLVLLAVYAAIATSTVTVPVLSTMIAPTRMEPRLASAASSLATEGPLISAIVMVMVGVVVIGFGLQDLG